MSKEKVTAGIPSLTPAKRQAIDTTVRTRAQTEILLSEKLRKDSDTVAPDGGIPTTSAEAQLGRPLFAAQVCERLRRCNSNFYFEVSKHDSTKMGIYILEPAGKRHICGMEAGIMPEFSVRHTRYEEVPLDGEIKKILTFADETRGWRTVLARLLRARLITEAQVQQHFAPTKGRDSKNWQQLTT